MSVNLEQALRQAAVLTFEELCCAWVEPWPADAPAPALAHGAAVAFGGPRQGWLELRIAASALAPLATSMLGEDAASDALEADALGELANVICGNLVPVIGGREAVFRLGAPGPLGETTAAPAAAVLLQLETGAAELRLHLKEAAA